MKYISSTISTVKGAAVFMLILVIGTPLAVQASILSFFGRVDAQAAVLSNASSHNSQTMPLPQASVGMGGTKDLARGGGDVTVENNALVSDSGPLGTQADMASGGFFPDSDQISLYVVKKGDTVGVIAQMFGVSAGTIRAANNLSIGATLREGDTLLILPVTGIEYKIKKGDTLAKIAKAYRADVGEIGKFNGLEQDSRLVVGDIIIIPDGEAVTPAKSITKQNTAVFGALPKLAYGATALKAGTANGPNYGEYYTIPVNGMLTQGLHGWNAVDIGVSVGTPVHAAAGGTVIVAKSSGWNSGYGDYVVIKHDNGTQTLYAHLSRVSVTVGETVARGEEIGKSGSTGRSTGPHVHFEVRGAQNPYITHNHQ